MREGMGGEEGRREGGDGRGWEGMGGEEGRRGGGEEGRRGGGEEGRSGGGVGGVEMGEGRWERRD